VIMFQIAMRSACSTATIALTGPRRDQPPVEHPPRLPAAGRAPRSPIGRYHPGRADRTPGGSEGDAGPERVVVGVL